MNIRGYEIYNYKNFPYEWFEHRPYFNKTKSKREPVRYRAILMTFDIETTRIPELDHSVMYVWQAAVDQVVCVGRSWKEFRKFLTRLTAGMPEDGRIICFVHNLSYEFQFLRSVLHFEDDSVFMPQPRKILKAVWRNIEFRCSYLHSNMSLDEYTRKFGVEYTKVKGFDYSKPRYPWTPLTDAEMEYIVGDVVGLSQALAAEMKHDGDTLDTIPLTSTGYVRRELKQNMRNGYSAEAIARMQPNLFVFLLLNEGFRGGNCHANRFYVGGIVQGGNTVDRSSSYPAVECIEDHYPMGPWKIETMLRDLGYLLTIIKRHKRCFIARVSFKGIRLKDPSWGCPYLSKDKCRNVYCADKLRADHMFDNGRILYADYLETTITDVDLRIIMDEYTWDDPGGFKVLAMASCRAGKLPAPWIRTNIDYYKAKTELKDVEGQEIYYMKAKNKLNSIYGDTVQNPAKVRTVYKNGQYVPDPKTLEENLADSERYPYKNFAWGVWVTAWARYRLEEVIKMAHNALDPETGLRFNGFLYSDTDSVKYLGELPELDEYNQWCRQRAEEAGAVATDPNGVIHYMGEYESEGSYDKFITLGAKKYAAIKNGKLEITIAGVNKKEGAKELGCLENMHVGFTFHDAGSLEAIYNDKELGWYPIDGRTISIGKNVCLKDSSYTIGIGKDFARILKTPELYLEIFNDKVYSIT